MFMSHGSMMSAHQPALKKGNYMMHPRQELAWRFWVSLEKNDFMDEAFPFQWIVAQPCISAYNAAAFYGFFDKRNQTACRGIGHSAHSDPTNSLSIFLSGNYNQCLPFRLPAANTPFWATKIGFVNLDFPSKTVAPRPNHCAPQFMQPSPCRLITPQAQDALEPKRISAGFLVRHKPHSLKPCAQRLPRSLEDCASSARCLPLAACASQKASGGRPSLISTASRATKTGRPPKAPQIISAGPIGSKPAFKFLNRPRIIHPADRLEIIAHHYILRLRERNG
jgi:hypothetical protein